MNTWVDKDANLEWCTDEFNKMTWQEAMDFAEDKGDGWRLPTIKELLTLIEYNKYEPAINNNFPNCNFSNYWSASPTANNSNFAWYVNFKYGYSYVNLKYNNKYVRLVRSMEEMK